METTYNGGTWLYFLLCTAFGILIGLFSGWLLVKFKLKIFDLSLGMNTMLYGWVTFFIGSLSNSDIDITGLAYWNNKFLLKIDAPVIGSSGLHISFIWVVAIGVLLHLFLTYTTLGRGVYAVGSDRSVAIRTGFNIQRIYLVVFGIMGGLAGFAGVVYCGLYTFFRPVMLISKNMLVLAAVVLGGASTRGGKGTVFGVFIGTILIGLINQALVYIDVSTKWYDAVIGLMFQIYATFQSGSQQVVKTE
jgi:ribose/xylose/arabinose/galactoside ABC-type transport system permease subunit